MASDSGDSAAGAATGGGESWREWLFRQRVRWAVLICMEDTDLVNVLLIVLTVFDAIAVPFSLAFHSHTHAQLNNVFGIIQAAEGETQDSLPWFVFAWFVTAALRAMWYVVEAVQFVRVATMLWVHTASGRTVLGAAGEMEDVHGVSPMTATQMTRSAFAVDVASLVSTFFPAFAPLRVVRIARTYRLTRYFVHWETKLTSINPTLIRLLHMVLWLFFLAHWISCGFFAVSEYQGFGSTEYGLPQSAAEASLGEQYGMSFYWSIMTLAGNQGIEPSTRVEKQFNLVVVTLGMSASVYVVGNLTSVLANANQAADSFRDRMALLQLYMQHQEIPRELQNRISNYYRYTWSLHKGLDVRMILEDLPTHLRSDVSLFLNAPIIRRVPLFEDCEPAFINALVKRLRPELCGKGDVIIRKDDNDKRMFFLCRGRVDVTTGENEKIAEVNEGGYFGEIGCFFNERRQANCVAATNCQLYVLEKDDLDDVMKSFPEYASRLLQTAVERVKEDNENPTLSRALIGAARKWKASVIKDGGEGPTLILPQEYVKYTGKRRMRSSSNRGSRAVVDGPTGMKPSMRSSSASSLVADDAAEEFTRPDPSKLVVPDFLRDESKQDESAGETRQRSDTASSVASSASDALPRSRRAVGRVGSIRHGGSPLSRSESVSSSASAVVPVDPEDESVKPDVGQLQIPDFLADLPAAADVAREKEIERGHLRPRTRSDTAPSPTFESRRGRSPLANSPDGRVDDDDELPVWMERNAYVKPDEVADFEEKKRVINRLRGSSRTSFADVVLNAMHGVTAEQEEKAERLRRESLDGRRRRSFGSPDDRPSEDAPEPDGGLRRRPAAAATGGEPSPLASSPERPAAASHDLINSPASPIARRLHDEDDEPPPAAWTPPRSPASNGTDVYDSVFAYLTSRLDEAKRK